LWLGGENKTVPFTPVPVTPLSPQSPFPARTLERWAGDQPIRKTLWAHAVKKACVRYRRPYQTRHTYTSVMLSAGEHPTWVAGQMGHSDWTMIARVYGRWMPSNDTHAGGKAERMLDGQKGDDE